MANLLQTIALKRRFEKINYYWMFENSKQIFCDKDFQTANPYKSKGVEESEFHLVKEDKYNQYWVHEKGQLIVLVDDKGQRGMYEMY